VVDTTMDGLTWLRKQVEEADTDLLREMVKLFCERLMGEEVDAICGAPYGERSEDRTNRRNGYRAGPWDTRTGTIDLAARSFAREATSPTGCSSPAGGPSGRSSRWSASPTSGACRHVGLRVWSERWESSGSRGRRDGVSSLRLPRASLVTLPAGAPFIVR